MYFTMFLSSVGEDLTLNRPTGFERFEVREDRQQGLVLRIMADRRAI